MKAERNRRQPARKAGPSSALPLRQLRWIGMSALLFAAVAVVILSWEQWFPTPPEELVEVAWTHECRCAPVWIQELRGAGFTVRDFEMENLRAMRRQWQVPDAAPGCHPARYLGYVLDGHVSAATLQRLAREHPLAFGVVQIEMPAAAGGAPATNAEPRFELIDRDGTRHPWT